MAVMLLHDVIGAFNRGVAQGAAYMVIQHGDYPVYCTDLYEAHDAVKKGQGMTREVYDLRAPRDPQIRSDRAWNLPPDDRDPLFDLRMRQKIGISGE